MIKERILIKVSGGSLKSSTNVNDPNKVADLAHQIKTLTKKYTISLVIGGGNIFRGNVASDLHIDRNDADAMGMLATVINGLILMNVFKNNGIKTKLFSALKMDKIVDEYTTRSVNEALDDDYVCIFVAGIGLPHFTTDTGAALRAVETKSKLILMAKNGVDGVYDKDPLKYPDAKHFDNLSYEDIINRSLEVIDQSALTLCWDNNVSILVFNASEPNCLIKAMNKEIKTTIINQGDK